MLCVVGQCSNLYTNLNFSEEGWYMFLLLLLIIVTVLYTICARILEIMSVIESEYPKCY